MRCSLILVALVACSGDPPTGPDADPRGPLCSKQTYDLCSTEHDCTNFICHNFMAESYMICTQACDAQNPCPKDKNGTVGQCDNGICKPAAGPNMCHL